MIKISASILIAFVVASAHAADTGELQDRRQRAAVAFTDGILLLHALSVANEGRSVFQPRD
jgi:hypothetical protein